MSTFDPAAFTPPLRVPRLASAPLVLRPYAVSDLALVRQAAANPFIPSISSVPRTYTDQAGRAFITRQHARGAEGDGYSFVIAPEAEPRTGIGSIGLWLQEIESGQRRHRLLAARRHTRARSHPQIIVIDDFLSIDALDGFRRFCLNSPVWDETFDGYLGGKLQSGFVSPLLAQAARDLSVNYPAIFKSASSSVCLGIQIRAGRAGRESACRFCCCEREFLDYPR